jgi:hypothetical protein
LVGAGCAASAGVCGEPVAVCRVAVTCDKVMNVSDFLETYIRSVSGTIFCMTHEPLSDANPGEAPKLWFQRGCTTGQLRELFVQGAKYGVVPLMTPFLVETAR